MNEVDLSGSGLEFPKGGGPTITPNDWCILINCGVCNSYGQVICIGAIGVVCPGGGGVCIVAGGFPP